jgi:hypothetical protein
MINRCIYSNEVPPYNTVDYLKRSIISTTLSTIASSEVLLAVNHVLFTQV